MNHFMRITFPSTDDNTISSVRSEFAHRLRKMNLRYKSDIYYPESSWSTPAFGVPEELTFLIGAFTFGGGYAMLPLIQDEVIAHNWIDSQSLIDFKIGRAHV